MSSGPAGGEGIEINLEVNESERQRQAEILGKAFVPGLTVTASGLEGFFMRQIGLEAQVAIASPPHQPMDSGELSRKVARFSLYLV